jgi:ABC-type thiamin/hydroxymethylpyrimidine transport system permease subunit
VPTILCSLMSGFADLVFAIYQYRVNKIPVVDVLGSGQNQCQYKYM